MKHLFLCIVTAGLLISCASKSTQNTETTDTSTQQEEQVDSASIKFFPVTSFIKGQFIELDSLPVTILKIATSNNKVDSSWLKKEEVKPQLMAFVKEEINETNLLPYFKQSKFNDQTVDAITFTHDPIGKLPDSISLRHWDVYVQPQTGTIRKVYIVKQIKKNGNNYTKQLTWQTGKWAKLVEILNKPDGSSEVVNDTKFVWDFNE